MRTVMRDEPLWTIGGVTALVTALVTVMLVFGWVDWSETQTESVLGVVAVLAPLVVAAVTRSRVWAPQSVDDLVVERTSSVIAGLVMPELEDSWDEGDEDSDE